VTSAPLGADFLDRRLLFFTGKGGVGKSTVTAATALLAAERGRRVLLVEVDAKGNLTSLFEHEPVGFKPAEVYPGVFAMQMRTEAALREYLKLNLRIPVIGRLGPLANVLEFVATAAPGVKEILTSATSGRCAGKPEKRSRVAPTGTWSWSTPPPPVTCSPSSTPPERSRSWSRSARSASRRSGWSSSSRIRP